MNTNNNILTDKNGREMKTGDIVKIENAFFKNDNGYYFIDRTPGDRSWTGSDYSLKKISKSGKISTAARNIAFWPLWACTNNHDKNAAAREHNKQFATIEIIDDISRAEVVAHFEQEASDQAETAKVYSYRYGEAAEVTKSTFELSAFFKAIADRITAEESAKQEPETESAADLICEPELIASVVYDFGTTEEETTETEPEETTDDNTQLSLFDIPAEPETEAPEEDPETVTESAPEEAPEEPTTETTEEPETTEENAPAVKYYDVSEETARRGHESVHMSDYKPGSATNEYRASVDEVYQIAEKQKKKVSVYYHARIDALADKYARKLAQWTNDYNRNSASCPSWFICGPANYPVRKHERQMSRERSLWNEYDEIKGIIEKIKATGTGPIDLADPHAKEMLTERLEKLEKELENSKAINAFWRKNKTLIGCPVIAPEKAEEMTKAVEEALQRCPWQTSPVPAYELTSLRDKIKRTSERLEELTRRQETPTAESEYNGFTVVENNDAMRLQIIFPDKPDEETRNILKSYGFKWAPSQNAWQRQLTDNARRALNSVISKLQPTT